MSVKSHPVDDSGIDARCGHPAGGDKDQMIYIPGTQISLIQATLDGFNTQALRPADVFFEKV